MYISLAVLTFIGIMSSLGESKQASYGLHSQDISKESQKQINSNDDSLSVSGWRRNRKKAYYITMVPGGDYYIWSLMSHRNCGFVKTDGRPSGGISVDIKAIGNYGEAAKVRITEKVVLGFTPKQKIKFTQNGAYMAVNASDWTVKALGSADVAGYNCDFDIKHLTKTAGYEMYYSIHPWSRNGSPTKVLRAYGNGDLKFADFRPRENPEFIDPGTLFSIYRVT